MEIVVVLGWCDGFGNDTYTIGVFDSVQTARSQLVCDKDTDHPMKYVKTQINNANTIFDWYDAEFLFAPNKKKKKKKHG